jgi:hypothetical protein
MSIRFFLQNVNRRAQTKKSRSSSEDGAILEVSTSEDAYSWNRGSAYPAALKHRYQGDGYRAILIEDISVQYPQAAPGRILFMLRGCRRSSNGSDGETFSHWRTLGPGLLFGKAAA